MVERPGSELTFECAQKTHEHFLRDKDGVPVCSVLLWENVDQKQGVRPNKVLTNCLRKAVGQDQGTSTALWSLPQLLLLSLIYLAVPGKINPSVPKLFSISVLPQQQRSKRTLAAPEVKNTLDAFNSRLGRGEETIVTLWDETTENTQRLHSWKEGLKLRERALWSKERSPVFTWNLRRRGETGRSNSSL